MSSDVLLVYKKTHEAVHDESRKSITEVLQNIINNGEIRLDIKAREKVSRGDFIGRDLVIIHGGDGTLTSISHNIDSETPVMGVNSHPRVDDPEGSLGFFMDSDIGTFAADFETALMGKAINNRLPRLQATITSTSGNKIVSDPALNDLLVANTHQYAPSKYRLQRGDFDIKQHRFLSRIDEVYVNNEKLYSVRIGFYKKKKLAISEKNRLSSRLGIYDSIVVQVK